MLLKITERCRMGCTHCMDDAKPTGKDMDFDTLRKAIEFYNLFGGVELIISGAEPTEHPDFKNFIRYIAKNTNNIFGFSHVTVTTNGMNLDDSYYPLMEELSKTYNDKILWQVTHVPKYYKIPVDFTRPIFKRNDVVVCNEIEAMYPLGRAVKNNLPWSAKAPKCFNIRSAVRSFGNLQMATLTLNKRLKFCTPQIDVYGNIKLGESMLCPVCSNINKSHDEIVKDISNFKCEGCKIILDRLPKEYLKAIGEN